MTKNYQTKTTQTSALAVPEQVSVAMEEIAEDMREGLLALAVGAGLQVMQQLMEADVTAACGAKGKHNPDRAASRHGTEAGSVTLGGRRVPVTRPRVRATDGTGEVAVPAYELFNSTELLGKMAMERMLGGLSTRRYPVGLEPVGGAVEEASRSTSKSAVSRKFVAMTEHALGDLLVADLSELDLVALMIDGVHFADHLCVVALGIDVDGTKHPLALVEGSTENTTLVRGLLVGLRERGLDVTQPILAVLDGAKALTAAVKEVFDHPVLARCQIHKLRNVRDHLPEKMRGPVTKRMRAAYHADSALEAQALLEELARELDKTHPGAAGSLREGLAETLTVLRLDLPPTLARTLRSTNAIESMIGICREHAKNVKRWRDGQMALRWCAAGMVQARTQFRRVNGHLHLPALRAALERHVAGQTVDADCNTQDVSAA
ncbi:MAG TPA: IS256 family transposase [Nocardioides sp.]|uniref:IS256 family transposase n=1 Tax=Nocardioides sp. TaxID=35761 RepID=UPI002E338C88|nr:IS256 family transposase [Nocardioides sp.]HEX3930097.1 IS256 family transposase [Nocardioides sp.]